MPDASTLITPLTTTKPKRARKPSKPRAPRVKDAAILAIEAQAKAAKDEYRKSQASGGVLKRIVHNMLPRLTKTDRMALYNVLSNTEAKDVIMPGESDIGKAQQIREDAAIASAQ